MNWGIGIAGGVTFSQIFSNIFNCYRTLEPSQVYSWFITHFKDYFFLALKW